MIIASLVQYVPFQLICVTRRRVQLDSFVDVTKGFVQQRRRRQCLSERQLEVQGCLGHIVALAILVYCFSVHERRRSELALVEKLIRAASKELFS